MQKHSNTYSYTSLTYLNHSITMEVHFIFWRHLKWLTIIMLLNPVLSGSTICELLCHVMYHFRKQTLLHSFMWQFLFLSSVTYIFHILWQRKAFALFITHKICIINGKVVWCMRILSMWGPGRINLNRLILYTRMPSWHKLYNTYYMEMTCQNTTMMIFVHTPVYVICCTPTFQILLPNSLTKTKKCHYWTTN